MPDNAAEDRRDYGALPHWPGQCGKVQAEFRELPGGRTVRGSVTLGQFQEVVF